MKCLIRYVAFISLTIIMSLFSYLYAQDNNNSINNSNNDAVNNSDSNEIEDDDLSTAIEDEKNTIPTKGNIEEAKRYLKLGDDSFEKGFYQEALMLYKEMKKFIPESDYLYWGYYYNRLAQIQVKNENITKAIKLYKKADSLFKDKIKDLAGDKKSVRISQADNLLNLSIAHRINNDFNSSLETLNDAIFLYETYGDDVGKAKAFISKANLYYYMENYDKAETFYMEALVLYETQDNYLSIGRIYNNLGAIYVKRRDNDYETAIEFYLISIEFKLITEDYEGASLSYRNIAVLYDKMGELRNSYEMMTKCVDLAKNNNDKRLEEYERYLNFLLLRLNDENTD